MEKDLRNFLERHRASDPVSFHMPGHKGMALFEENGLGGFIKDLAGYDITEIAGADNLFQPETVIARVMEKYRGLYGTKKSYLLINGSSAGIIASVMTALPEGGRLIMARNSHKSAYNALRLVRGEPVYVYPGMIPEYGIQGAIDPGEIALALDENPDAKAVILPSPNYYGVCSDISAVAEEVHRRGGILIVDQAHGAHLKFFGPDYGLPGAAEDMGADIVINSTHKTLASFTQTAVLNVCSDRVDTEDLEDRLQMIESTSPSYPLMATLDINAGLLIEKGRELIGRWAEDISYFYDEAKSIKGLRVMDTEGLDRTKINLDMSGRGFDGDALENFLMERGIYPELVSGNIVMCMSGIGNRRGDYERLLEALREASELTAGAPGKGPSEDISDSARGDYSGERLEKTAIPQSRERIPLRMAEGRVCASLIIPYPPGIPIACPGEILTAGAVEKIFAARSSGRKVIGVSEDLKITVGRQL